MGWIFANIVFLLVVFSKLSIAQEVQLGLFQNLKVNELILEPQQEVELFNSEWELITTIKHGDDLYFKVDGNQVRILKNSRSLGVFDTLRINDTKGLSFIKVNKQKQKNPYITSFKVFVVDNNIQLISALPIEEYITGVVAAESGFRATDEYYKVQAIIARTYALFNKNKHKKEGFDICDNTHCQVYHGMIDHEKIKINVYATSGQVVVDSLNQLIAATYHSNSGGETMNAEDVWAVDYPYLKSVKDEFSLNYKYVNWVKEIDSSQWIGYFSKMEPLDSLTIANLMNFEQSDRKVFIDSVLRIPLTKIRTHFNLKSTYFSVTQEGQDVILKGKGFGHGVGLSQIGAMEMAKIGFTYEEIIQYYYHNVAIVNFSQVSKKE